MISVIMVGLYTGPGSFGGVNNYIKLFLNNINNKKVNINYYSLGKSPNWYNGRDKPTQIQFQLNQIKKLIQFPFYLKKKKADVVHLNSGMSQLSLLREGILSLIAKCIGCRTLFFLHGWKENEFRTILSNIIKKKLVRYLLNKQDALLVLSTSYKKKLESIGIDRTKIYVKTTMVESDNYRPSRKNFNPPYQILFCSRLVKEKGPYELLDAAKLVLNKNSNIKFVIMGDGKEFNDLLNYSKKLEIEYNVLFTGFLSGKKKFKIFKESHIFILPSYTEGLPNVILEAMAAGLVLLATPVGGIKDVLKPGRNGLVIKSMPPNPNEIFKKLSQLIENPGYLKKVSLNNIKDVTDKYDSKLVTNQICLIYENL